MLKSKINTLESKNNDFEYETSDIDKNSSTDNLNKDLKILDDFLSNPKYSLDEDADVGYK